MSRNYSFDDMCFPLPDPDLEYALRYSTKVLSREDMLYLASVLNVYRALINKTQKDRNYVCKRLKEKLNGKIN